MRAVAPERTFWEKAALLHEETYREGAAAPKARLARHYYDLWCLITRGVADRALADTGLFERVAAHRTVFFRRSREAHASFRRGSLRLVPDAERRTDWKRDYMTVRGTELSHVLRVRSADCSDCGGRTFLFPGALVSLKSRSLSNKQAFFGCFGCGAINQRRWDARSFTCSQCGATWATEPVVVGLSDPDPARAIAAPRSQRTGATHRTACPLTTHAVDAPLMRLSIEPSDRNGFRSASHAMIDKITVVVFLGLAGPLARKRRRRATDRARCAPPSIVRRRSCDRLIW